MLIDPFQRKIRYLRISVTDRCNLRCVYCRPAWGERLLSRAEILSLEELFDVAAYAVGLGIDKIRLTGGEPLMRKSIEHLVERIASLSGLSDFGMTTNGTMLKGRAALLKASGLHRLNISLDTLRVDRFREITRGGELADAIDGIEAAQEAGFRTIKLNSIVIPGVNEDEREDLTEFGRRRGIEVRFIRRMKLCSGERYGVEGSTTAGLCRLCNRLRLTSAGDLKPCLFDEYGANVRKMGVERAFDTALTHKPAFGMINRKELMYQIGG